jgi:hypothetical protein
MFGSSSFQSDSVTRSLATPTPFDKALQRAIDQLVQREREGSAL